GGASQALPRTLLTSRGAGGARGGLRGTRSRRRDRRGRPRPRRDGEASRQKAPPRTERQPNDLRRAAERVRLSRSGLRPADAGRAAPCGWVYQHPDAAGRSVFRHARRERGGDVMTKTCIVLAVALLAQLPGMTW